MKTITFAALTILFRLFALAGDASKHQNVDGSRLALQGFDPLTYFDGKPQRGSEQITAEYNGAIYRFSSDEHRKAFATEPAKYAPAYGGWCATAMAEGKKVEIDPQSFKVTNGRLFLFYNGLFADARKKWLKDESNLERRADDSWKKIVGE